MSGQHPKLDRRQVIGVLQKEGFRQARTHASHGQWEGYVKGKRRVVTVKKLPRDTDLYSEDLAQSMIRQSGLKKKAFYSLV